MGPGDASTTPAADLDKLKRYFAEAAYKTKDAREASLVALDFYDSDQYTSPELRALETRRQPPVVINRIKPAINGIIGVIERGRSDPRAWPRNPGNDQAADAATDVLRYIADFNRFKRLKRDCFLDMLVPGTCAALVGVDGDRQVTITQVRWEEFFHDPQSRRADFKDGRYLGIAKWMYADDLAAMYPAHGEAIDAASQVGAGPGLNAGDESFLDRPLAYSSMVGWVDAKQRRLMVVEMYYRERGWKRCVFTGADVLEAGDSPYLDHKGNPDCPIEAMSAYVKRDNARYGAVHDMIDIQREINKRRSKALHLLTVSRIEVKDASAINVDADEARLEAARPDGVLPFGWAMSPNTALLQGNLELLQEAKGELERMGPSPAMLGRNEHDDSGRALLARQQSGLLELSNLYGALEDWELRVYRQCWARVKQYWTAPQFIRVTDDENAPRFVGLNQPVLGLPTVGRDPVTGMASVQHTVLGYRNAVAEMDVDIEIDATPDTATVQQEAFNEILRLVAMSPAYQQQVSLKQLIQLSPMPHKRSVLDALDQAAQAQTRAGAQQQQIAAAKVGEIEAKAAEAEARAGLHHATAFAHVVGAVTQARDSGGPKAGVFSPAMTDKPRPKDDPDALQPKDRPRKHDKQPKTDDAPDAREPDPNNPESDEGRDPR